MKMLAGCSLEHLFPGNCGPDPDPRLAGAEVGKVWLLCKTGTKNDTSFGPNFILVAHDVTLTAVGAVQSSQHGPGQVYRSLQGEGQTQYK